MMQLPAFVTGLPWRDRAMPARLFERAFELSAGADDTGSVAERMGSMRQAVDGAAKLEDLFSRYQNLPWRHRRQIIANVL